MTDKFICPICNAKLNRLNNSLICEKKHSFDISAKGYVHLLPSNKMNSKLPGDNKMMINARRDFLALNLYKNMADSICNALYEFSEKNDILLDAGCGEGYYTHLMEEKLTEKNVQIIGIDISKSACNIAGKQCKQSSIAVASVFHIPVADNSINILTSLFAPFCKDEFLRVLKKDGIFAMVIPGPYHLFGLKEILYEKPYLNTPNDYDIPGFSLERKITENSVIELDKNQDIMNLFMMTPYYYKTGVEGHKKIEQINHLKTQTEFEILIYRKG